VSASDYRKILGVRFFVRSAKAATQIALSGGLVVVPAAPALVDLAEDSRYREALVRSDLAITDSGFMVLAWLLLRRFLRRADVPRDEIIDPELLALVSARRPAHVVIALGVQEKLGLHLRDRYGEQLPELQRASAERLLAD
jgi:hypothetical protein